MLSRGVSGFSQNLPYVSEHRGSIRVPSAYFGRQPVSQMLWEELSLTVTREPWCRGLPGVRCAHGPRKVGPRTCRTPRAFSLELGQRFHWPFPGKRPEAKSISLLRPRDAYLEVLERSGRVLWAPPVLLAEKGALPQQEQARRRRKGKRPAGRRGASCHAGGRLSTGTARLPRGDRRCGIHRVVLGDRVTVLPFCLQGNK